MSIERIDNVGIAVGDLDRIVTFFADAVGLSVERQDGEPRSAMVHVGDRYLYVFESTGERASDRREETLVSNPLGWDHIAFTVSDVDDETARLRERGVTVDNEPQTNEAWGMRLACFRDPEDNPYYLVQYL